MSVMTAVDYQRLYTCPTCGAKSGQKCAGRRYDVHERRYLLWLAGGQKGAGGTAHSDPEGQ